MRTDDFTLHIADNPSRNRFDLTLHAGSSRVCVAYTSWPNREGHLDTGALAHVVTDAGRFPAQDYNFGTCIGPDCMIRIEAGERIQAFIPYAEFPSEAAVASSSRRALEFSIDPRIC
jgi:hypothetical protein